MSTVFEASYTELKKLEAENDQLRAAIKFMTEIAEEEYGYARSGTGAEVALRHIIRRGREALGD